MHDAPQDIQARVNETLAGATTRVVASGSQYSLTGAVILHVYGFIQLLVRLKCLPLPAGA